MRYYLNQLIYRFGYPAFAIGLLVPWLLIAAMGSTYVYKQFKQDIAQKTELLQHDAGFVLDQRPRELSRIVRIVAADPHVQDIVTQAIQAQRANDSQALVRLRERLSNHLIPVANELAARGDRQLHIQLGPEIISFLRMHSPLHYGDELAEVRPMMVDTFNQERGISGFEIGRTFSGFRATQPLFSTATGQVVGTVEVGTGVGSITWLINQVIEADVALLLPADITSDVVWPDQKREHIITPFGKTGYYVDGISGIDLAVRDAVSQLDVNDISRQAQLLLVDGQRWLVTAVDLPVYQEASSRAAKVLLVTSVDQQYQTLHNALILGWALSFLGALASWVFVFWVLKAQAGRSGQRVARAEQERDALFYQSPEPVEFSDEHGALLARNPAFGVHFGREADVPVNRCLALSQLTDEQQRQMQAGLSEQGRYNTVLALPRKGRLHWYTIDVVAPWRRQPGVNVARLWWFYRDVDRPYQEMLETREQKAVLDELLAGSPAVVYAVAVKDKTVDYVSANIARVLGYTPEQVRNQSGWWRRHIHPDDRSQALAEGDFQQWAQDLKYSRYRLRAADGHYLWVTDTATVIRDRTNEPKRLVGTLINSDDTIALERKLADSERLHRSIFENIDEAVFLVEVKDQGAWFVYAGSNPAHTRKTGIETRLMVGQTPQQLLGSELGDGVAQNYRACVHEQRTLRYSERLDLSSGTRVWDTSLSPVLDDTGAVVLIVGISVDQTAYNALLDDQARNARRLERAQQIARLGYFEYAPERGEYTQSTQMDNWFGPVTDKRSLSSGDDVARIAPLAPVFATIVEDHERQRLITGLNAMLAQALHPGEEQHYRQQVCMHLSGYGGRYRYIALSAQLIWPVHVQRRFLNVSLQDITERVQAEQQLRVTDRRNTAILQTTGEGIVGLDADGRVEFANQAACDMLGYRVDQITGVRITDLLYPSGQAGSLALCLAKNQSIRNSEDRFVRSDGSSLPVQVSVSQLETDRVAQDNGYVVSFTDLTEQKDIQERLEVIARTDQLTGLPNRRAFIENLAAEHERVRRYGEPAGVCMFDLDLFKQVNDLYGHPVGDAVLTAIGDKLQEQLRAPDTAGRLGGEEFALILTGVDRYGLQASAERIRRSLGDILIETLQGPVSVTASMGCCLLDPEIKPLDSLSRADQALYQAKQQGRDQLRVWAAGQEGPSPHDDRYRV